MTKSEIREMVTQYRDSIKGKRRNPEDVEEYILAYMKLWNLLLETGLYDWSFEEHFRNEKFTDTIAAVDTLSFEECCTYLSMIPRIHRLHGSWFWICIEDGSIYKLLSRLLEVM